MQAHHPNETTKNIETQPVSARQILPICVQNNQYGIDLIYVECVLPLTTVQPLANSADYLIGLMDYRGKSVPVIDLGRWLGVKTTEPYNLDTPVIICKSGQKHTAFVVTDVMQVEAINPDSIKTQNTLEDSNANFEATVNLKSHKVLLFDMKHVLAVDFTTNNSELSSH